MTKDGILEILRSKLIEVDNWNQAIPSSDMHNIADEILLEIKNHGDIGNVIDCDHVYSTEITGRKKCEKCGRIKL